MARKRYLYSMPPIDFWSGWMTRNEYIESVKDEDLEKDLLSAERYVKRLVEGAEEFARITEWEGDYRQGPFFSGIPSNDGDASTEVIIAWKQDNNGTTFVLSPYQLPWLDEWLIKSE